MIKMKIRDFSKACGISASTLRYYEKMGFPSTGRSEKGYRQYAAEDVFRINTFNALTAQGFTLSEAGKMITDCSPEAYCKALEEKTAQLREKQWLLGKQIEWNQMIGKVYSRFETLENRPFEISIPECRFLPCTDGVDPSPSLNFGEQVSAFVRLLPASCYAACFLPGMEQCLGMMLETSIMERQGISLANTLPVPAGKTIAVLVRDYNGEDLRSIPAMAPYFAASPEQPTVYVVHLMIETKEYGPWPQFLLCHCPEDGKA